MAAKLCHVVFFKPGGEPADNHFYLLVASTLADGESVAGTIFPLTDGSPRPERVTTVFELGDVDRVLSELVGMVEELGGFEDWSRLSDCRTAG